MISLKKTLNAGIKFVYDLNKMENITPCRVKAGLFYVSGRRQLFVGNSIFSLLQSEVPVYLFELFISKHNDDLHVCNDNDRKTVFMTKI